MAAKAPSIATSHNNDPSRKKEDWWEGPSLSTDLSFIREEICTLELTQQISPLTSLQPEPGPMPSFLNGIASKKKKKNKREGEGGREGRELKVGESHD